MALQGSYDFKGITLSEAYLQVSHFTYNVSCIQESVLKTAAVLFEDGSVKTKPVYELQWVKKPYSNIIVQIFKDKATKDENPNNYFTSFGFDFPGEVADVSKNHIKQAYVALKADDKYKDYTDV
jgi:hypothetical protein|tara:strand:- start:1562 stop:1933 length:372 start_codon:yes stop_codon:yes gene_type:complete